MISRSNSVQDAIWLRNLNDSNMRRVTLRRNFTEETTMRDGIEDTQIVFEEVDVLIHERDNMISFIESNFGNIFDLGLMQMEENEIKTKNINETKAMIANGNISSEIKLLGQQITDVMLGG